MNIPFNILSAADPKSKCMDMVQANLKRKVPTHWFSTLDMQRMRLQCTRHPYATTCDACPVSPDIGICGTPCHPFSRQRQGRFLQSSVEDHGEFDVSMSQFFSWMERFEPRAQVCEQVLGFDQPFHCGSSETPLQRFLA